MDLKVNKFTVLSNVMLMLSLMKLGKIAEHHYFQNFIDLETSSRKKVFIHVPYEKNERNWGDFYGRSSNKLNIDLCSLCIKSIIYHCSDKYDVILYIYDNGSVEKRIVTP